MFTSQLCQYRGIVQLAGKPYMDDENDINGNNRKVRRFPLKLVNSKNYLSEEFIQSEEAAQIKETKTIPQAELVQTATHIKSQPGERTVVAKRPTRNPVLFAYAKLRADGVCECFGAKAPFSVNGEPYLEITHIIPVVMGGIDSADNLTAVYPNCNKKMALVGNQQDIKKMQETTKRNEKRLQKRLRSSKHSGEV